MKRLIDFTLTYCVLIFAASLILTGCVTEKKRLQICKICPLKIERHDTTIVERETIHDTVYQTVTVTTTLPNPCQELCDENGRLRNGVNRTFPTSAGSVTLTTRNDSLIFTHRIDSIMAVNSQLKETVKRLVTIHEQVPARCERDHLSGWDSFFIRCGQIWLGLMAGTVIGFLLYWRLKRSVLRKP